MPQLLLIAGTGRESGKTLFACSIINHFKSYAPLVACKISRHRHKLGTGGSIIIDDENIYIAEEFGTNMGKDSSRLLAAGAIRSFYVVTADEHLLRATEMIIDLSESGNFYVFESGGLRQYVKPGLFIMMKPTNHNEKKHDAVQMENLADVIIEFDGRQFDLKPDGITITENSWKIKK